MIQYAITTIICSGLLYFLYKLLLENEKMHVFKRFFLLLSVAISLTAPLITISISSAPKKIDALPYISKEPVDFIYQQPPVLLNEESNNTFLPLSLVYLAGVAISFIRFGKRVAHFFTVRNKKEQLKFNGARLILVEEPITPHSFIKTIFLNKAAYENGLVEPEILAHELAHIRQLHSIDVLFAQFLRCFFWFNPFLPFYTKAIQLNHEFLADEAATRSSTNHLYYQQLLLAKASGKTTFAMASEFNFLTTKKRLLMITKETSRRKKLLRQFIALPLLLSVGFVFTTKEVTAQVTDPKTEKAAPSTTSGASQELLEEYKAIVEKHRVGNTKEYRSYSAFSDVEKERLYTIYKTMTKEQQDQQLVRFMPRKPFAKSVPTEAQLKSWTDSKMFGVWLDGRRTDNQKLTSYKATDFDHYFISKLSKTAINYGKHYYQVDLMTKAEYAKYLKESEKQPPYYMIVRRSVEGQNLRVVQ